ncbi:MAG: hypothetical protein KKE53_08520 [Proteobacteria bacterium]|nr:hypothetical protein [Pseudomonadota bacterium]
MIGVYETEIEISLKIYYSAYPEEKRTWYSPGVPAHVVFDNIEYDVEKEIEQALARITSEIMEEQGG